LGNQFFQYAAAYSTAKKRNSDLYICVPDKEMILNETILTNSFKLRRYSLDRFNVPQNKLLFLDQPANVTGDQYKRVECCIDYYVNGKKAEIHVVNEKSILTGTLPDDKILRFGDYFESEIFFSAYKSDILNLFQPTFDTRPIDYLKSLISSTKNSVSLHIRRGDFSSQTDFRLISLSYQKEAMQLMKQKLQTTNVTFFVFTDDLPYVKKHLTEGSIVYMSDYTEGNTLYDFILMALCQHNIITNSSFSWWAAYLNRNRDKIVVAPMPRYTEKWINAYVKSDHKKMIVGEFAYPDGWLTIRPTFLSDSSQI